MVVAEELLPITRPLPRKDVSLSCATDPASAATEEMAVRTRNIVKKQRYWRLRTIRRGIRLILFEELILVFAIVF